MNRTRRPKNAEILFCTTLIFTCFGCARLVSAREQDAGVVLNFTGAPTLKAVAQDFGIKLSPGGVDAACRDSVRLVVLEPRTGMTDVEIQKLGEAVRQGKSLLVILDAAAGKDAFDSSFILPTMAWTAQGGQLCERGPFIAANFDSEMFGSASACWPFAPGSPCAPGNRMGIRLDEYAYKPGETIHAQVTLDNGTRNIAALAKPADLTTPDNPTLPGLNSGFSMSEREAEPPVKIYASWNGKEKVDNDVTLTFPQPTLINAVVLVGADAGYRLQDRKNPAAVVVSVDGVEVGREEKLADRFLADHGRVRFEFAPVKARTVLLHMPWGKSSQGRYQPCLGDLEVWGTADAHFAAAVQTGATVSLVDN